MKQNWFLLGDIHGEAAAIEYFYNHHRERLKLDDCQTRVKLKTSWIIVDGPGDIITRTDCIHGKMVRKNLCFLMNMLWICVSSWRWGKQIILWIYWHKSVDTEVSLCQQKLM